ASPLTAAARRAGARAGIAQIAGLGLAVVMLPVPIAFALYFCAVHSLRHVLALAEAHDPARPTAAAKTILAASAGATALTIGAAALLIWVAVGPGGLPADAGLARGLFWGLAALTLPHVLLERLAARAATTTAGG
ncbi:MAG: hypothetical protein GVY28_02040, partial [Alphaproteobacteria bacterium]|nr:hypothetical protein [Alphaproteobacteria bacterium]